MRHLLQLLAGSLLASLLSCAGTQPPSAKPLLRPAGLLGEWTCESIAGEPALGSSPAFLAFEQGGRLSGHTGLNQISGAWSMQGSKLTISQLISTLRAGPAKWMAQEQRMLKALGGVRGARNPQADSLVLVDQEGTGLLRCRRSDVMLEPLAPATLSGEVSYREKIALRPGHRLTVELQDVSRADAPAILLGRWEAPVSGQVPFAFSVSYDPQRVQPRSRYSLRAMLHDASGQLAWTTTQAYLVLSDGAPTTGLELLLQRVP